MLSTILRPKGAQEFAPPDDLVATALSSSVVQLDWSAVPTAEGYHVERDGAVIAIAHPDVTYLDDGLAPATEYEYRVRPVREV